MPLTTLIAEDEPLAREGLADWVRALPHLQLLDCVADGASALTAIRTQQPDLVLMDIQMPGMTGLQVLRALADDGPRPGPAVIFTTAYDEYALTAFELHAVDYLLKPFSRERFDDAVQRVVDHADARADSRSGALPALEAAAQAGGHALAAGHDGHLLRGAVGHGSNVVLLLDVRTLFDQQAAHLLAFRAGLVGLELHAEDLARQGLHLVQRAGKLDTATLATTTRMDLRLHDPDRPTQLLRGLGSLLHTECGIAAGNGHAELAQDFLTLVLVDFHGQVSDREVKRELWPLTQPT